MATSQSQDPENRSEGDKARAQRSKMHQDMLRRALRHYWHCLNKSIRARRYLKARGLTSESIKRYGIGYAEASAQSLRAVFPNYQVPALLHCGLAIENDKRRYDRFRDRIIFPILDEDGCVIAFGGRLLEGDGPKYLNSPRTELFDKGATLFGMAQAKSSIATRSEVIVAEGYMDVVMSAQHGVGNIVATLGTATTTHHVEKLLATGAKRVVFCFDGDDAGRNAALKAMESALEASRPAVTRAHFAFLPMGVDPDSLVRSQGVEAFRECIAQAMPLETFLLNHLMADKNLETCEGRAGLTYVATQYLPQIKDSGMFYRLCESVADAAGYTVAEVIHFAGQTPATRSWSPVDTVAAPTASAMEQQGRAQAGASRVA